MGVFAFFLPKLLSCPQAFCPARLNRLLAARDGQRVGRHVLGDHRAGADIGAVADLDRRHQRRIRADEGALADIGAVLGDAVVIAGDGAGADIGARADPRIADIGSGDWPWRRPRSWPPSPRRNCRYARPARDRRPGRSRANGPTRAPLPTCAPSRCEKARIVAPSATVTPGPNTTFGSMVTSLPNLVSAERNTVSGAIMVTPASSAAARSRFCRTASVSASCALVLMPRMSSSPVSIATAFKPISRAMATASVR